MRYRVVAVIILCLAGSIIYSNTFNVPFQFDDKPSIAANLNIRDLANPKQIWDFWPTRFITYLTISLNYSLHKLNPFGYHLFNLIVHLCSGIMVWLFFLLSFSTPAMKDKEITLQANLVALCAGLIFVAHPIQTGSVTYIIQRTTSLAALFYLTSLNLYIKSRLLERLKIRKICYLSSLLTGILAVFTKETAMTLPFAVLLYEYYFLKTKKKINWKKIAPFLVILLIIPLVMLLTKSVNFMELRRTTEMSSGISPWHYFLTQPRVMVTYIRLLFLPINQNLDYDFPITQSILNIPTLASLLILLLIAFVAMRIFSKHRLISFAIFWFFLTLLPESSIIPIKDLIFEHRLYLPMVGFSIFIVSAAYHLLGKKSVKIMTLTLILLLNWYGLLAYNRNIDWQEELTLWDDTVHKSPGKARPYNNRGWVYQDQGDLESAYSDFTKAIEIDPGYVVSYYNLGLNYKKKGDLNRALSYFNQAIEIDPEYFETYNNRGVVYKEKGNLNLAITDWNKAIQINPDYFDAYLNRANAYASQGKFEEAFSDYDRALRIKPGQAAVYYNRGIAYFLKQEYSKSWQDILKAKSLGYKIDPKIIDDLKDRSGYIPE